MGNGAVWIKKDGGASVSRAAARWNRERSYITCARPPSLYDRHVFCSLGVSEGLSMLYATSDVDFQSTGRPDRTELLPRLIPLRRL